MFEKCNKCYGAKDVEGFGFMRVKCPACEGAGVIYHVDERVADALTADAKTVAGEGVKRRGRARSKRAVQIRDKA